MKYSLHRISLIAVALFGYSMFLNAAELTYKVDQSHSNVNFEVDHLVISTVTGSFTDFDGSFKLDDKGRLKMISGTVKAASIDTNNEKRDKHLRSEDFFHVKKHPTLTLKATDLNLKKGKRSKTKVKLTMNGVTKEVPFIVRYLGTTTDPWGTEKAAFRAEAEINRKDFGLNWNETLETGGVLVGEEVQISLNIQGNKSADPKAKGKKEAKK